MEVWEAALTFIFFIILIVVAYSADVEVKLLISPLFLQIWKSKKANLKDELELEMADVRKGATNLEGNIKRYASQLSLEPDYTVSCLKIFLLSNAIVTMMGRVIHRPK